MLLHWRCHPWWLILAIALLVKPSYPTDSQVSITKFGLYQMATSCKIFCQISDLRLLTAFLVLLLVRITGFLSLLYFSCPDSFHQYGQAMVYLPDTVSEAVHPVVPLCCAQTCTRGSSSLLVCFSHTTRVPWGLQEGMCGWLVSGVRRICRCCGFQDSLFFRFFFFLIYVCDFDCVSI